MLMRLVCIDRGNASLGSYTSKYVVTSIEVHRYLGAALGALASLKGLDPPGQIYISRCSNPLTLLGSL